MFKDYAEFWRWLIDTKQLAEPEEDQDFAICPFHCVRSEPEWSNHT